MGFPSSAGGDAPRHRTVFPHLGWIVLPHRIPAMPTSNSSHLVWEPSYAAAAELHWHTWPPFACILASLHAVDRN